MFIYLLPIPKNNYEKTTNVELVFYFVLFVFISTAFLLKFAFEVITIFAVDFCLKLNKLIEWIFTDFRSIIH